MFYKNIKELQIENTSICNAACPMCVRELTEDKSWFEETYLDNEFFETRIPDTVWQGLDKVLFNGVIGDPCAAPNFLDVCRIVKRKAPQAEIRLSTNGGMRNADFWQELATILTGTDHVIFALDGLADTNHIYRVNVRWNKVMSNAMAFINAGGNATWQFITFKHNQHQVEAARKLALDIGFNNFYVKPSYRFVLDEMIGQPKYGSDNVLIEAPTNNVHPLVQLPRFNFKEWQASTNDSTISCYAQHSENIYIEYTGRLFPCCPLSSGLMYQRVIKFDDGWDSLWNEHGQDKIDLKTVEWDDIVNGPFFAGVKDRWEKDYANGRLAVCAGVCSNSKLKFNHKEA